MAFAFTFACAGAPAAAIGSKVYFVDYEFESHPDGTFGERFSLNRVNPDGSGREEVVHSMGPQPQYAGLTVADGIVYWNDFSGVTRAATTGGTLLGPTAPPSLQVGAAVSGRAADAAGVYTYSPQRNPFNMIDGIGRADADFENVATLVHTHDFEPNLAIELDEPAGKIYWAGSWGSDKAGLVQRANLSDGSAPETLLENFTSDDYTVDLALDPAAGKLYLANSSLHTIQRANLDGSGLETIVADTAAFALALDPTPEPAAALVIGAAAGCLLLRRRG
jgi:hypothetical protein